MSLIIKVICCNDILWVRLECQGGTQDKGEVRVMVVFERGARLKFKALLLLFTNGHNSFLAFIWDSNNYMEL